MGTQRPSNRRKKSAEAAHLWVSERRIGRGAVLKRKGWEEDQRGEEER